MSGRRRATAMLGLVALVAALGLVGPTVVSAHTETDVIAAPAGRPVTVSLRPTHGCDGSPSTDVTARVPVAGATAGAVEGWTPRATDDGRGHTVVEWTGGSLPADREGAFPVTFTVPDTPGELVLLPFIQTCENGEELSWIDGDPTGDFPAPRLLVLAADAEPVHELDELPADTPGRDKLTAIVDVDGPTSTTAPSATVAPTTTAPTTTAGGAPTSVVQTTRGTEQTGDGEDDDGLWPTLAVLGAIAVAASGAVAVVLSRRRRQTR